MEITESSAQATHCALCEKEFAEGDFKCIIHLSYEQRIELHEKCWKSRQVDVYNFLRDWKDKELNTKKLEHAG